LSIQGERFSKKMNMQRRTAIKNLAGALIVPALNLNLQSPDRNHAKPVLRVAHLTDVHLKDEWDAPAHFSACLHHEQSQQPKVDFILNGGDIVFDMNKDYPGARWKGNKRETAPGYGLIDLYGDGSFEERYIQYQ
jgi:hypothetical protein